MQNKMRDKLVELIQDAAYNKGCVSWEELADFLIENGVIAPPCKVGGKIYYIDKYSNKVEEDIVKFFTVTQNGVKPILTWHNTKFWDIYEWSKTVFLTKEEAEKALKEGAENG